MVQFFGAEVAVVFQHRTSLLYRIKRFPAIFRKPLAPTYGHHFVSFLLRPFLKGLTASQPHAYRWHNAVYRGVNVTIAERDTRKRLLINRHIAKMAPEEIARRFTVYVMMKTVCPPKSRARTQLR